MKSSQSLPFPIGMSTSNQNFGSDRLHPYDSLQQSRDPKASDTLVSAIVHVFSALRSNTLNVVGGSREATRSNSCVMDGNGRFGLSYRIKKL